MMLPINVSDKKKSVQFDPTPKIHYLDTWSLEYQAARKGEWERVALDRHRFERRIAQIGGILSPILSVIHRNKIFRLRFEGIK